MTRRPCRPRTGLGVEECAPNAIRVRTGCMAGVGRVVTGVVTRSQGMAGRGSPRPTHARTHHAPTHRLNRVKMTKHRLARLARATRRRNTRCTVQRHLYLARSVRAQRRTCDDGAPVSPCASQPDARAPRSSKCEKTRRHVQHDPRRRAQDEDASAGDVHDVLHEEQNNTAPCTRDDARKSAGASVALQSVGVRVVE